MGEKHLDGWTRLSVQLAVSLLVFLFCAGGDAARRSAGCEGVAERIIPISQATNGNAPVTDKAKVMPPSFSKGRPTVLIQHS